MARTAHQTTSPFARLLQVSTLQQELAALTAANEGLREEAASDRRGLEEQLEEATARAQELQVSRVTLLIAVGVCACGGAGAFTLG
jgi:hypothetical protein